MIYYYIPDFFWHYNVNIRLLELIQNKPEMFYDDFKIGAVFGNFPNCIWNGGGHFHGRYVNFNEMKFISNRFNSFNIPLRLTMTNPILEKNDMFDRYANYIMENLENGLNQVLISSPILEAYVRETYPNYSIVRSILSSEEKFYDDSDKYFMSVMQRKKNNDIDFLKSIKNKEKIELLVNETCNENCEKVYEHYREHAKLQMYLDHKEDINTCCIYNRDYPFKTFESSNLCITRDKIKEIYEPMGFKHFKISGRASNGIALILFYSHYMVKPEYSKDFMNLMYQAIINDTKMNYNL